jgi:hypothetical protein
MFLIDFKLRCRKVFFVDRVLLLKVVNGGVIAKGRGGLTDIVNID